MSEPVIAAKAPIAVDVEAGKTYYWCVCGQSATQPFCDGKHKGTAFKPLAYTPDKTDKVFLCACKQTSAQPMCDGSHRKL